MTQYFFAIKTWLQLWENEAEERKNCAVVYTAIERLMKNYKTKLLSTSIEALYEHMYHTLAKENIEAAIEKLAECKLIEVRIKDDSLEISINTSIVVELEETYAALVACRSKTQHFSIYYFALDYATEHSITSQAFAILFSRLAIDLNFGYFTNKLSAKYLQKKFASIFSLDEIKKAMTELHDYDILINTSDKIDFEATQYYMPNIEHIQKIIAQHNAKMKKLKDLRYKKYSIDFDAVSVE